MKNDIIQKIQMYEFTILILIYLIASYLWKKIKLFKIQHQLKRYEHHSVASLKFQYEPQGIQYYRRQSFIKYGDKHHVQKQLIRNSDLQYRMIISNLNLKPYLIILSPQLIYCLFKQKSKMYKKVNLKKGLHNKNINKLKKQELEIFKHWFSNTRCNQLLQQLKVLTNQTKQLLLIIIYLFTKIYPHNQSNINFPNCQNHQLLYFISTIITQQNIQKSELLRVLRNNHSQVEKVIPQIILNSFDLINDILNQAKFYKNTEKPLNQRVKFLLSKCLDIKIYRQATQNHYLRDVYIYKGTILEIPISILNGEQYSLFGIYQNKCPFASMATNLLQYFLKE